LIELKDLFPLNVEATIIGVDVSPIDIVYSSSYKYFNDEGRVIRGRSHPMDDLSDLKIKAPDFDGNLKLENYLNWVQTIEGIFELKKHNDERLSIWLSSR